MDFQCQDCGEIFNNTNTDIDIEITCPHCGSTDVVEVED